jgi:hypothetical protein
MYPYHVHMIQHFEPGDLAAHMDFCHCLTEHSQLKNIILFRDEGSFTWDGVNNM